MWELDQYLVPCVVEYSIIVEAIFMKMFQRVGKVEDITKSLITKRQQRKTDTHSETDSEDVTSQHW